MLKKNAAQRWWVRCIDGDTGYMATGQAASITATISKDSGSFVATNDTNPTEQSTSGYYYFDLTDTETNASTVDIVSVHSSSKYRVEPLNGERFTSQLTATAVWDEAYSSHTTAGTFGKLMDILRKANTAIDGTVTAAATPTTSTFTTDLTDPTSTHKHQLLVFTSGSLEGMSRPIESYNVTNGAIVLQESLTLAPQVGDEFSILIQHVHPVGEIAQAVQDIGGLSTSQAAQLSATYSKIHSLPVVLSSTAVNLFSSNPLTIYRGSEHSSSTPLGPVTFNVSNSYDVTGWTGTLKIFPAFGTVADAVVSTAGSWADEGLSTQRLEFTLDETDTDNLDLETSYKYQVELLCGAGHPYASPSGSVIIGSIHS